MSNSISNNIKHIVKYTKYLTRNILIKKAFYISIIISVILMIVVGYLQIHEINKRGQIAILNITTFVKFAPFLFTALFSTLIITYIFKDGETDGSELIIISKPITRFQLLIGKFLTFILFMISFHIFLFGIHAGIGAIDKFASTKDIFNYASSLAIGGFVVQMIYGSIVIIFAAFMAKAGVIAIGITLAAFIPIFSMILTPVAKGQKFGYHKFGENRHIRLNTKELFGLSQDISSIEEREIYDYINLDEMLIIENDGKDAKSQKKAYEEYRQDVWYDKASYFDLWYQWGRFMSIFSDNAPLNSTQIVHWYTDKHTITKTEENKDSFINNLEFNPAIYPGYTFNVATITENNKYGTGDYQLLPELITYSSLFSDSNSKWVDDLSKVMNAIILGYARENGIAVSVIQGLESVLPTLSFIPNDFVKLIYDRIDIIKDGNLRAPTIKEDETWRRYKDIIAKPYLLKRIENLGELGDVLLDRNLPLASSIIMWRLLDNGQKIILKDDLWKKPGYLFEVKDDGTRDYETRFLFKNNETINVFKANDFIDTNGVLIAWSIIGIALLGLSILIYMKRDFK